MQYKRAPLRGSFLFLAEELVEPLRTVIFVDGQNLRKNLQTFRFGGDVARGIKPYKLDEKHFAWGSFFPEVIEKFNQETAHDHRLIRTYWYNAEAVSPFHLSDQRAQEIAKEYGSRVEGLTAVEVRKLAKVWYERNRENFYRSREEVYEPIQRETDFLEFKYVGQFKLMPGEVYRCERDPATSEIVYFGTREGEKGVDVGIAVDMISKMAGYDAAILVSGDADFYPAVKYLKDGLKQVYQFSLAKGIPPNVQYLSAWLKGIVDAFSFFDELELLKKFLRLAILPAEVQDLVRRRITELERLARH